MNPLGQRCYSVNAIVADIGWITDDEKAAVEQHTGPDTIVHFDQELKRLHLYWQAVGDTLDNALDEARGCLRRATEATGVACPRIIELKVQEIGE